jgi:spermidine/putrescine transport system permease protein
MDQTDVIEIAQEKLRPTAPLWTKLFLITTLFALFLPLLIMLINSFSTGLNTTQEFEFTADWYRAILSDENLLDALYRSVLVAAVSSLIATAIGTMAALSTMRAQSRLTSLLSKLSYVSLVVPELVFALSLLSWFFILSFSLSLLTVIIAHVTFSVTFVILTISARLSILDPAMEDAARDLGASESHILRKITLPLLMPAIASAFTLAFLLSFDDFLITFYTSGVGADTLPIKLYAAMKMGLSPKISALASLMFAGSLVLLVGLLAIRGRMDRTRR